MNVFKRVVERSANFDVWWCPRILSKGLFPLIVGFLVKVSYNLSVATTNVKECYLTYV